MSSIEIWYGTTLSQINGLVICEQPLSQIIQPQEI